MAKFGALWVGRPLSKLEQTSLASFVYHGHEITLYVYNLDMEIPNGVIKKDAREILPEDSIFMVDNSYGPFADMFRYKMIQDTGLIWTDTDNICLRADWDTPEYLFGLQGGPHELVAIGILKIPQGSELLLKIIDESTKFDKDKIVWGEIGPQLLTQYIHEYNLKHFIRPVRTFYPVNYWEWEQIWKPKYKAMLLDKCKNSYTLQVWNQMRNRKGLDPNVLPTGSAMEHFYNLYVKGNN